MITCERVCKHGDDGLPIHRYLRVPSGRKELTSFSLALEGLCCEVLTFACRFISLLVSGPVVAEFSRLPAICAYGARPALSNSRICPASRGEESSGFRMLRERTGRSRRDMCNSICYLICVIQYTLTTSSPATITPRKGDYVNQYAI